MTESFADLPRDWTVSRVDRVAWVNARIGWKALTAAEYQPEGYVFLSTPNIKNEQIDFENVNYISSYRYNESPELKLAVGDVLLAKDGNTLGITNVVHELPRPATVNGSIAVLRPFGVEPRFLRYVLASEISQDRMKAIKDGMGVPHLFQWDIKRLTLPLPPADEQRRIANFLDAETSRLGLIRDLRRAQHDLLGARLWSALADDLGAIGARKLPLRRALGEFVDGPFGSAFSSDDYVDQGAAVVRLGNIGFNEYRSTDQAYISIELYRRFLRHSVRHGDILIAGLGDARNHAGRACVAPELGPAIVKGKCFRARANSKTALPGYVSLILSSPIGRDALVARGSTRSMINLDLVKQAILPLPDLATQAVLVKKYEAEAGEIARAQALLEASIASIDERRAALITAVVTGELDVTTAGRVTADLSRGRR